jgi:hypothetical protein
MYRYLNKNPMARHIEDCTVRAISTVQNKTWSEVYDELSDLAKEKGLLFSDAQFIEDYLDERYERTCYKNNGLAMTVGEFVENNPSGTYLVTMRGHISCVKEGILLDTWDCRDKLIWCSWRVA